MLPYKIRLLPYGCAAFFGASSYIEPSGHFLQNFLKLECEEDGGKGDGNEICNGFCHIDGQRLVDGKNGWQKIDERD